MVWKVFAGEYGVSNPVIEDFMRDEGVDPTTYTWVDCDRGYSWCVPEGDEELAYHVNHVCENGLSYEHLSNYVDDGVVYPVGKAEIDGSDVGIHVYLIQNEEE